LFFSIIHKKYIDSFLFTRKINEIEVKEAAFHWQSLFAILNKSTSSENAVLKSMAEWQFDPASTLESLPEEKFEVFSLFLWGEKSLIIILKLLVITVLKTNSDPFVEVEGYP